MLVLPPSPYGFMASLFLSKEQHGLLKTQLCSIDRKCCVSYRRESAGSDVRSMQGNNISLHANRKPLRCLAFRFQGTLKPGRNTLHDCVDPNDTKFALGRSTLAFRKIHKPPFASPSLNRIKIRFAQDSPKPLSVIYI